MSVPKLRFNEFDVDWDIHKLGSLFTKRRDKGIANVPTYSVTLNNGIVNREDLDRDTVTNLSPEEHLLVKKDDLAYNMMRMWQGALGLAPTDGIVSPAYVVLKPNDKKSNSYFFEYYFKRNRQIHNFWAYSQGLTEDRLRLYFDDFKLIKINAPIKEEQTKIASFLSAVDEKISQLNQKHDLLSQYKQGMMQKLFSQKIRFKADDGSEFGEWEETKFLNLMDDLWDYRGKTPKKLGMDWGNGEIQSLSALNIKKGFIDFDADCHLGSEDLYKIWMNKGDLEKNDIIFTMEAPLGNVALIPDNRKYILSQRVVCFKTNKELIFNPFLFQLLLSDQFQSRVDELATGTTAKGINQKSMQKIEVKVPSLEEQTKIANFLSAIDQKVEVVAQQIEQAKTWKKGLLQQMFV